MSLEEKIGLIEELMDLDEGTLKEDSVLEEFEEWDSLSKLSIMAEVKKKFGKKLNVAQINDFKTVKDICDYMD
jgi:acyl carrier protein